MTDATDPSDPLGRIALQQQAPYDHPAVSETEMRAYWQRHHEAEARATSHPNLEVELVLAEQRVAACKDELAEAEERPTGSWLAGSWETEQRYRQNAIDRDLLRSRLVRLEGRRDALAAELARRDER